MELHYFKNARLLFLAMLGATLGSLAYLIFIYNPIEALTAKVISLYPGSLAFELWKKPPYDILLRFYIMNVTNSEEFLKGEEKLRFSEIGPYVYKEIWYNTNTTFNENGSLTFVPRRLLQFVPEYSVGDPDVNTILVPNVPLLGITSSLRDSSMFVNLGVLSATTALDSQQFLTLTINQYLYGYDDPLVNLANTFVPNWIDFPKFGIVDRIMALDNGTNIVTMNIDIDKQKKSVLPEKYILQNSIESWNGSPGLAKWGYVEGKEASAVKKRESCNVVQGSFLGTIFPQNIQPNTTFNLYRHAFCRHFPIINKGTMQNKDGIEGLLFVVKQGFLARKENNSDNDCYCKNDDECPPNGVGDMSPCYYDIPIAVSQPHFLNGDPLLIESIEGMSPNETMHGFYMIIHPQLGIPIEIKIRLQINLRVLPSRYYAKTKPFHNLVLPLFWVELSVDTPPPNVKLYINLLCHILPVVQEVLMYILALCGVVLVFGSAVATLQHLLYARHKPHMGLKVNYSEIPVFPLKAKLFEPDILIKK